MPLFKVAVMKKPRKKKDKEELLWMSEWFVAEGPEQAGMKAVVENREQIHCEFEDMEILVSSF